jgi:predicted permease
MGTLGQDFRFALRLLWKDRVFTATAVLTLAICIGANTALFTVVRSVLFRPLPYPEAGRLVHVYDAFPGAGAPRAGTSVPNYLDRRTRTDAFEDQALYQTRGLNVGEGTDAERVSAMAVTPSFFRVLKVDAFKGRTFTDQEGEVGHDRSLLLSYAFWQRNLGGAPGVVGSDLRVGGEPYTIVGIMPDSFTFLDPDIRLWLPIAFSADERSEDARYSQNHDEVARLRSGVTLEQAQHQIDALNAQLLDAAGALKPLLVNVGYHSVVVPLGDDMVRNVRGILYLLWGGVLFVLLIAVVNITNLVLVRASGRAKEMATRHVLGAGPARLARQLFTETTLLAIAGGLAGLVLGIWGLDGLKAIGASDLPRGSEIRLDGTVVAFTLVLALALGALIGLVPIAQVWSMKLAEVLQQEGRSGTAGRGARIIRQTLAAAQVAIAFVLLIGAGLLLASFQELLAVDPGFQPARVLSGRVSPNANRYPDDAALASFVDRALERVRALPGVESAGATSSIPFGGNSSSSVIVAEGYVMAPGESVISPNRIRATPGYFETLGVKLLSGRFFDARDTADAPRVVIVDERLARKFWPGKDPVGRRMFLPDRAEDLVTPGPNVTYLTVVGVVGAVKREGLIEGEQARLGAYYFPYAQDPTRGGITLAIRTTASPSQATEAVRRALAGIDPELPFYDVRTMSERMERSLDRRRTPMMLATSFAIVALLLAIVGIYGVLAYQVGQRTREVGIRIALGSSASGIRALVLREGAALVGAGLIVGLGGAVALRQAIAGQLYGIGPLDPRVLVLVTMVLSVAALVACLGPARRAARVDPVAALTRQ